MTPSEPAGRHDADSSTRGNRLPLLGWLIFVGYLCVVGYYYVDAYRSAGRGESPMFTDFTPIFAASLQLRAEPPVTLYMPRPRYAYELQAAQAAYGNQLSPAQAREVGFSAWMHPPIFMLFCLPLAFFPYLPAFLLWAVATALPYVLVIGRIISRRGAAAFALAAPPVFYNLIYGQTGFLSAGFIGLGLLHLAQRPVLAGVFIGLASFKPHFGVLLPVALLAGRHWRAFGSATATVLALLVLTLFLFGDDPWFAFIGMTTVYVEGFDAAAYDWRSMVTVMSTFLLAGASINAAWQAQYLVAAAALAAVVWAWWRRDDERQLRLQSAIVCSATVLALPMAYLYDAVLLVPALAWLKSDLDRYASAPWEHRLLWGLYLAPLAVMSVASLSGLQFGPLISGGLLLFALRRLMIARSSVRD